MPYPIIKKISPNVMKIVIAFAAAAVLVILLILAINESVRRGEAEGRHVVNLESAIPCDLRNIDFNSEWAEIAIFDIEYYAGVYLNPDEIDAAEPRPPDAQSDFATYRFTLLLPDNDGYFLYLEPNWKVFAGRFFVNGKVIHEFGELGTTYAETKPGFHRSVFAVTPEDGRLEVVVQGANFYHWETGVGLPWVHISKSPDIQKEIKTTRSLLFIGGLLGAAILLMGIWLLHIRLTQNLYFSLACIVVAMRITNNGDVQHELFASLPRLPIYLFFYLSLPLLCVLLILYLGKVFPGLFQRVPRYLVYGLTFTYALALVFLPPEQTTAYVEPSRYLMGIVLAYAVGRLIWTRPVLARDQVISLCGIFVMLLSLIIDASYLIGIVFCSQWIFEPAVLVFVVIQMIALFTGNARQTAEAKAAEARLAEQNAMLDRLNRLKSEFLSNVSHELKTPLTVVSGYAQTSGMQLATEPGHEAIADKMKIIASEADRLALMVGQILDITRIEEGRMVYDFEPCRIEEIMRQAVETHFPILNKNNNRLVFNLDESLPKITADPARISQVLVNLIANAIRFTQSGVITLSAYRADKFVEVAVSDTGYGIKADRLPTIFDRFNHTKRPGDSRDTGTGLGLFICKNIVEAHGGSISVESEAGKGTTVRFTVLVAQ